MLNYKFGEEFVPGEEKSITFAYLFGILYIQCDLGRMLEERCCNGVHTLCEETIRVVELLPGCLLRFSSSGTYANELGNIIVTSV